MHWTDDGVVLGARALGDANAILELLTREHGRHLGLVRGGRSRRIRPVLQLGNQVRATWKARLDDHLGGYTVEPGRATGAAALDDPLALAAIGSVTSLARLLPERDPHPQLYEATAALFERLGDGAVWPRLLVFWEMILLEDLGVGLDLSSCAATGRMEGLIYVSPKSARAVSAEAGAPYAEKLLPLPRFLLEDDAAPPQAEIVAALRMTGAILERHALAPNGLELPEPRARLLALLARP
jgi:DNA repair protein RecO (recombination protein O)